jgi:hypothetical protein
MIIMKKQLLKTKILSFGVLTFFLGASDAALAQYTWTGATNSDFKTATNWSATPAFNSTETFTIDTGGANSPVLSTAGYTLTSGAPTSGIITIKTTGVLTSSGNINVNGGCNDDGVLTVNGGLFNVRNNYYIGGTAGTSTAVANVEVGGSLNVKATLAIGQKQPGILNVNGGIVSTDATGSIAIGNYAGTYVNCYGTLNVNSGTVKVPKTGGLVISAGVVNIDGGKIELTGDQTASIATYISTSKIKLSTAAATAGKVLSNTYDSVTNLTTVMASPALGVEEFVADDFSIFPNPSVDGKFSITFPNGFEGAKVSIRTVLGQEIYKTTVGTATTVDVNPSKELASGIYFLQIEKDGKSVTKKLVVK